MPLGADGLPTGELKGPDAMTLAGKHIGFDREVLANDEPGLRRFARLCVRQGVTIGVTHGAAIKRHCNPAENELAAGSQTVQIVANTCTAHVDARSWAR